LVVSLWSKSRIFLATVCKLIYWWHFFIETFSFCQVLGVGRCHPAPLRAFPLLSRGGAVRGGVGNDGGAQPPRTIKKKKVESKKIKLIVFLCW